MYSDLQKLIEEYQKQWAANGMGAAVSYSAVISDLEKILKKEDKRPF